MADALAPLGMKGALGKHRRDTKRGRDYLTPTNSDIKKMTPIVEKTNVHSKIAENTNTNPDRLLLEIHPNKCFSDQEIQ